jgi:hypothetical protein
MSENTVVKVDQSMFDANQLIRVLGTLNKKGFTTERQPHRRSRLLAVPDTIVALTPEQLQEVAKVAPSETAGKVVGSGYRSAAKPSGNGHAGTWQHRLKIAEWLTARGRSFRVKPTPDDKGRTIYVLSECPFNSSHGDPDSCVMQGADGKLYGQCFHDSCAGRGWQDFKAAIGPPEPDHYDPPLRPKREASAPHDEEQAEADDAVMAELRRVVKEDAEASIRQALQSPWITMLARLATRAPGDLELFYHELKDAKVKARDIAGLRTAVKAERKRLAKERARAARPCPPPAAQAATGALGGTPLLFENFFESQQECEDGKTTTVRVGYPIQHITRTLYAITKDWPKRVGNLLFARCGDKPLWLERTDDLFAWISRYLSDQLALPGNRAPNLLTWREGADMVSQGRFFAYLRQDTEEFEAIELSPHHPPMGRTYYLHPAVEGGDGKALRGLRERFCPATPIDGDLIEGYFLSLVWGGPSGQRPAWLITADDENDPEKGRGVGKTKFAELGASLVGGFISLSTNEDLGELKKRLLSPDALAFRVAILDNIKSLKFSWADLEGLITSEVISGRRLYHGEGRRPNTLTYVLTLNGASLSKDMAQRCVIVKLKRPKRDADWYETTLAYICEHRWAILGDIIARLKTDVPRMARHSRWGAWEDAVLARLPEPNDAQKVIEERQAEVDDDAGDAEIVRQAFVAELFAREHYPLYDKVRIPVSVAAAVLSRATRENWPTNKATTHLKTLHIPELRYSRSGSNGRNWVWTGEETIMTEPEDLKPRPEPKEEDESKGIEFDMDYRRR